MTPLTETTPDRTTTARDLYPSRVADKPQILERQDPVLHGSPTGALTEAQRRSYESRGFLTLSELFTDDELGRFQREAERLAGARELADRDEVITEPDSEVIRSVFHIHRTNEVFSELARHPAILAKAREILGGEVYIHQSRINFKPGFRGKEFYWHSDFETWHVEDGMPRMQAVSCSISLTPNQEFNGPLMLIPGSHRHYVTCVGETPDDHYKQSLKKQEYGVPDEESLTWLAEEGGIEAPKGPAGSATFFECNTMHGSNSNIAPWPRTNVFLVFNRVDNQLVEPFGGTAPRPEFIACRENIEPLLPLSP